MVPSSSFVVVCSNVLCELLKKFWNTVTEINSIIGTVNTAKISSFAATENT
jgi:hypothetical protein